MKTNQPAGESQKKLNVTLSPLHPPHPTNPKWVRREDGRGERVTQSGEIQLARVRLAQAEGQLATAREQARLARRRRKEAKQAARRAKKEVRLVKEQVAEAELALAELETRVAQFHQNPAPAKPRKTPLRKTAVAAARKSPARAAAREPRDTLGIRKPAVRRRKSKLKTGPADEAGRGSITALEDLEIPVTVVPPSASKATAQIVREIEEIFTGETRAGSPVAAGVSASMTAEDQNPPAPDQTAAHSAKVNHPLPPRSPHPTSQKWARGETEGGEGQ
jgi:hypothetical protein